MCNIITNPRAEPWLQLLPPPMAQESQQLPRLHRVRCNRKTGQWVALYDNDAERTFESLVLADVEFERGDYHKDECGHQGYAGGRLISTKARGTPDKPPRRLTFRDGIFWDSYIPARARQVTGCDFLFLYPDCEHEAFGLVYAARKDITL